MSADEYICPECGIVPSVDGHETHTGEALRDIVRRLEATVANLAEQQAAIVGPINGLIDVVTPIIPEVVPMIDKIMNSPMGKMFLGGGKKVSRV